MRGTVKFFNETKGFGFIAPEDGSKDVFVHATALHTHRIDTLSQDQKVEFEVRAGKKGPEAANVSLVK